MTTIRSSVIDATVLVLTDDEAHDLRDTTGSALREARRRFCAADDWLSMIDGYTAANQRIYGPSARAEHDAAWEAFKAAEAAWEAAWADYYRTKATV